MMITKDIALYIHIPFCDNICHYCDFCHFKYQRLLALRWLEAFKREFKEKVGFKPVSIYIGGGTPTSLDLDILEEVLKLIALVNRGDIEYTIEINPETLDEDKARLIKKYGINRASIGLISSNDKELEYLGRRHSFKDTKRSVELLNKVGILNYSLDILYSFPIQTMDSFKKTIADALALKPKHLSLYSLTIEEGTLFYKEGIESFDEDIEANYYEYAKKIFEDNAYYQYEVSNFAKKSYESRHNLVYWHYEDFLGLSLGASSKLNDKRYDNTRNLIEYEKDNYIKEIYDLSLKERMFEMIMMSLRLNEGLDIKAFEDKFKVDFKEEYKKTLLKLKGSVSIIDNHLVVNNLEILNEILLEFMD